VLLDKRQWTALLCGVFVTFGRAAAQEAEADRFSASLKIAAVNGAQLHYLERGSGVPIVLVHGGLGDYREWGSQIASFSRHYRVVDYSRRYNYPNDNPATPDHSAMVEARDLAALLDALKLERVHLVGYSYGGLTALLFATQHPERVRSLTLAEPAIMKWLPQIPGGRAELDKFMATMWKPAGEAFRKDQPETALRITCDYFSGKGSYDKLPAEGRRRLMSDIREWKALTTSPDPFPMLDRDAVRRLKVPTLLITGEKTLNPMRMIIEELSRVMPEAERVTIPGATHDMWLEEPEACGKATLSFLAKHELFTNPHPDEPWLKQESFEDSAYLQNRSLKR
jgi:non-heme chloroperoxidase